MSDFPVRGGRGGARGRGGRGGRGGPRGNRGRGINGHGNNDEAQQHQPQPMENQQQPQQPLENPDESSLPQPLESKRDLSQLLCYFLRHGANKEGFLIYQGGYIQLADLVFKLTPRYTREEILHEVNSSFSTRPRVLPSSSTTPSSASSSTASSSSASSSSTSSSSSSTAPPQSRFALVTRDGVEYLSATYGHSFDILSGPDLPPPAGETTSVSKLTKLCIQHICDNIKDVESFEGFPDSSLLEAMMLELKIRKKFTVAVLKIFLVSSLERLSFESLYVSEGTLKLVAKNCPHLVELDLRGLGHILSDQMLAFLAKKLKKLRKIVLADNPQLTDAGLKALANNNPQLRFVDLRKVKDISIPGLDLLLANCKELEHVDLRGCRLAVDHENLAILQAKYPGCVLLLDESRDRVRFNSHDDPLWGPLSNNYSSSFRFKGHLWPTVTHFYQAQKYAGTVHEAQVREAATTSLAFSRGTDRNRPLRPDWEEVKREIMLTGLRAKFEQHDAIARLLLSTGNTEIVFASWRDSFWGAGQDGSGTNELGKLLMELRENLRREE